MLQRFGQVTQGAGKIKRKFVKKAISGGKGIFISMSTFT